MGTRRKSRELAMQMLFQGDLGKQTPEEVRGLFWPSRDDVDAETRGFAEDIYRVATERRVEIDALIETHAQNWRLERMAVVDRNLLRAAVAGRHRDQRVAGDRAALRGAGVGAVPERSAGRHCAQRAEAAPRLI